MSGKPNGLSRRAAMGAAGAALLLGAPRGKAQTGVAGSDWYRQARDSKSAAAAELQKFNLPAGTEPAFSFKA